MTRSTTIKILSLALLGFGVSGITLAFARPKASSPDPTYAGHERIKAGPIRFKYSTDLADEPGDVAPTSGGATVLSNATMRYVKADVQGDLIAISAKARLLNQWDDNTHVWHLRVVDSHGNEIMGQLYDHQIFHVPPGDYLEPTFDEVFSLPLLPGSYRAEVTVYEIRTEKDLGRLLNSNNANVFNLLAARGSADLVIQ